MKIERNLFNLKKKKKNFYITKFFYQHYFFIKVFQQAHTSNIAAINI